MSSAWQRSQHVLITLSGWCATGQSQREHAAHYLPAGGAPGRGQDRWVGGWAGFVGCASLRGMQPGQPGAACVVIEKATLPFWLAPAMDALTKHSTAPCGTLPRRTSYHLPCSCPHHRATMPAPSPSRSAGGQRGNRERVPVRQGAQRGEHGGVQRAGQVQPDRQGVRGRIPSEWTVRGAACDVLL